MNKQRKLTTDGHSWTLIRNTQNGAPSSGLPPLPQRATGRAHPLAFGTDPGDLTEDTNVARRARTLHTGPKCSRISLRQSDSEIPALPRGATLRRDPALSPRPHGGSHHEESIDEQSCHDRGQVNDRCEKEAAGCGVAIVHPYKQPGKPQEANSRHRRNHAVNCA
jgi:hypothetical protein